MSPGRDRTCLPSARLRRREATWSGAGRGWVLQGGTGKELQYLHPFCFLKGSQLMPVGALTKGGGQSCSCWGDPGSRPRKALRETLARHFGIFFKLLTPLQMKPAAQRGAAEGRGYWDWRGPAARFSPLPASRKGQVKVLPELSKSTRPRQPHPFFQIRSLRLGEGQHLPKDTSQAQASLWTLLLESRDRNGHFSGVWLSHCKHCRQAPGPGQVWGKVSPPAGH